MKKIRLKEDERLIGWKTLVKGTQLNVSKFNSRFVYIELEGKTIRLPRKSVEIIY